MSQPTTVYVYGQFDNGELVLPPTAVEWEESTPLPNLRPVQVIVNPDQAAVGAPCAEVVGELIVARDEAMTEVVARHQVTLHLDAAGTIGGWMIERPASAHTPS